MAFRGYSVILIVVLVLKYL